MKAWIAEYYPLTQAVETLKINIIKGRAPTPSSELSARHVNPNKDVKTCPCCLRAIAVVSKKMAHHGYTREEGGQSQSCPGINFRPLEISPDGLVFMSDLNANSIAHAQDKIAKAPNLETLEKRIGRKTVVLTRSDADFAGALEDYVRGMERAIRTFDEHKQQYDALIATWKPAPVVRKEPSGDSPSP